MPWIIVFVYSWILFLIFFDKTKFRYTVYGGIIAAGLGTAVDWTGHRLKLYSFQDDTFGPLVASIFYVTGPLFTMGVLFFQYLSLDRRLQAANVAAFSLAYLAVETLIVRAGGAHYHHWHYTASLGVDLLAFTALSYIGKTVVYGRGGQGGGAAGMKGPA